MNGYIIYNNYVWWMGMLYRIINYVWWMVYDEWVYYIE